MKTTKSLWGMLAILAFTACAANEGGKGDLLWDITLQASMGDGATRALSEGTGNAITASFAENDEVVVVDADGNTIVGTLTALTAGHSTTLTGTLDASTLAVGEVVTLHYHSATANYDDQTGTLEGISARQDYAEGTLTVSTTSPLTFTSGTVALKSRQSITKFTFTDGSNAVAVKTFGMAAVGLVQRIAMSGTETVGAVTGTLATASSDVYVALRNNSGNKQTYSFTIQDASGDWYTGGKSANLSNGKNYTASVTLKKLPPLNGSSATGDIGVIDGLPAIVVDLGGTKKAVALMNAGALCPEDYGEYYTFAERTSKLSGGWYVPSQTELEGLAHISSAWMTQNGVNGKLFTAAEGKTFFLPAAGFYDNEYTLYLQSTSEWGYYWSSTEASSEIAICLNFSSSSIVNVSTYQIDGLTVRPFHAL